jgi:hypothetical protein
MTDDVMIPIPMSALDDLMDAAQKYLEILGRQGVRPEFEEQWGEAMRAHTVACQAISSACQRASLELTEKPTGAPLH